MKILRLAIHCGVCLVVGPEFLLREAPDFAMDLTEFDSPGSETASVTGNQERLYRYESSEFRNSRLSEMKRFDNSQLQFPESSMSRHRIPCTGSLESRGRFAPEIVLSQSN